MTLVKMYSSLKKPECFDSLTAITCSFNQPISIWTNVECLSLIFRSHFVKFSKSYTSCPKLSDICLWLRMQLFKISNLWQKKTLPICIMPLKIDPSPDFLSFGRVTILHLYNSIIYHSDWRNYYSLIFWREGIFLNDFG